MPTRHICGESQGQVILLSRTPLGCLGPHVLRRSKTGKWCIYNTEFRLMPLFSGAICLLTTFWGTAKESWLLESIESGKGLLPQDSFHFCKLPSWHCLLYISAPETKLLCPLLPTPLLGGRVSALCAWLAGRGRKRTKSVVLNWWLPDHCWPGTDWQDEENNAMQSEYIWYYSNIVYFLLLWC